jgi:hypothetical protein
VSPVRLGFELKAADLNQRLFVPNTATMDTIILQGDVCAGHSIARGYADRT